MANLFRTEHGSRIRFYFYNGIPDDRKAELTAKIQDHGGRVTSIEPAVHPGADTKQFVILVNTDAQLYKLRKSYEGKENVRISKTGIVDLSIKRGSYSRSLPPSMTPKPPVVERVPYTAEDEENMVRWLATRMPHKADGGRAGNLEWQELCSRAEQYGENQWAKRHTWQSWRDHYKHKQENLDTRIDKLVELYPPSSDRKGMAPVKRSVKRLRMEDTLRDDSDEEVFDLSDDETDKEQMREEAVEVKEEEQEEEEEEEEEAEEENVLAEETSGGGGNNRKRSRTGKGL